MTFDARRSPKISIGLPVHNGERFLPAAIDSVLSQSYADFELIISDNASSDATDDIIRDYARRDHRIRHYRLPQNIGAAPNFNRLVHLARGRFFKWASHDDVTGERFLERCLAPLADDPSYVLSFSHAVDIDEQGQYLKPVYDSRFSLHADSQSPAERFRYLTCVNHSCLAIFGLIRIDALKRKPLIGPYPGSDRVLLAELSLMGKFFEVPEVLLFHREHTGRSTRALPELQRRFRWFNPSFNGKRVYPNWRILREYLNAVQRSSLPMHTKLRCLLQLLRWLRWNNWRLLLDDLTFYSRHPEFDREVEEVGF